MILILNTAFLSLSDLWMCMYFLLLCDKLLRTGRLKATPTISSQFYRWEAGHGVARFSAAGITRLKSRCQQATLSSGAQAPLLTSLKWLVGFGSDWSWLRRENKTATTQWGPGGLMSGTTGFLGVPTCTSISIRKREWKATVATHRKNHWERTVFGKAGLGYAIVKSTPKSRMLADGKRNKE